MYSLASNTTGYGNCATGYSTLMNNTTGGYNVANGTFALLNNTASDNVAVGYSALNANTIGSQNSALGTNALLSNTTGIYNVAIGHRTLTYNINGKRNIAIGGFALDNNIAGDNNIDIGLNALRYQTSATNNVSIGEESGTDISTGSYNTFMGAYTGLGITNGSYNTILGGNVTGLSSGLSHTIILADGAGTKRLFIDNAGFAGLATVTPTAALHVNCTGISNSNPSNVRFENLQSGSGHFLVIDNNGYVLTSAESGIMTGSNEIAELKNQVAELQQQVKELMGTKTLNTSKILNKNSLEIVPSPFDDNAKAIYHIDNFRSNTVLQIVSSTGVVMKIYSLNQADGQIEIGKLPVGNGVVTFSIIANGKNIISKKSVKM